MQRRRLLKLGLFGTIALTLVGGGVALIYPPAWRGGRLTQTGRHVLEVIARAVLDGTLPSAAGPHAAALVSHLDRMESTLRALPPPTQHEVANLLALLATAPGRLALTGLSVNWAQASVDQTQVALEGMRTSGLGIRRQAYHALRDLTHAAYFASPETWPQLGYPGPVRVARAILRP